MFERVDGRSHAPIDEAVAQQYGQHALATHRAQVAKRGGEARHWDGRALWPPIKHTRGIACSGAREGVGCRGRCRRCSVPTSGRVPCWARLCVRWVVLRAGGAAVVARSASGKLSSSRWHWLPRSRTAASWARAASISVWKWPTWTGVSSMKSTATHLAVRACQRTPRYLDLTFCLDCLSAADAPVTLWCARFADRFADPRFDICCLLHKTATMAFSSAVSL